jgi:serine-type anaerobic sulfatase-maturating enzyme
MSGFQVMTKPIGPICNLDCKYCYYLEKEQLFPQQKHWQMQEHLLEEYIKQNFAAQEVPVVSFAWQGGEPTLLGVDFFQRVVALQKKHANGKSFENALQTNGTLLDDEWCQFFVGNNFLIGISIDGPEHLHDQHRLDKNLRPSYRHVMQGIKLLKKHQVEFNTLTVVNQDNVQYPIDIYRFLKDIGSRHMQFIPVVERSSLSKENGKLDFSAPHELNNLQVTDWSVGAEQYGQFLCDIFDVWIRKDVGRFFIQIFEVALQSWLGMQQSLCVFRETCGSALVLEHNGDIYSCDHFVYPEYKLGNIANDTLRTLVFSDNQQAFGQAKYEKLPKYCMNCEVRFACNGECPKHRFVNTPDGETGLNYLCAAYKQFFTHIKPYMEFMSDQIRQQRSPMDVMQWKASN